MNYTRKVFPLLILSLLLISWLGIGCSEDNPTDPGAQETQPDPTIADSIVTVANLELGELMNEAINQTLDNPDSSFRPNDVDFSAVNSIYEEALFNDPNNLDAKFGSAFTGLMMFMGDAELNDLYDRIKYTVDTIDNSPVSPIELLPYVSLGDNMSPDGLPLNPSGFTDILPSVIKLDNAIVKAASTDPQISEIQAVIENSLLPRVITSRERILSIINTDPNFTFTISPQMQGNMGSPPIIIDQSDFCVISGALYAAEAALHVFLARNLDLTSYTVEGVENALTQSSDFLSLRANNVGANHMSSSKTCILSAEAQIQSALDNLFSEIGTDQTNHLIKVYSDDAYDLNRIKDSLTILRSYFDGPRYLNIIIDNRYCYYDYYSGRVYCYGEFDTYTINVDISKFFDAPMDNPKIFIPAYTIAFDEMNDFYKTFANEHFSSSRYWDYLDTLLEISYPNDTLYFDYHLPEDTTSDEFYQFLADNSFEYNYSGQAIVGWDDFTINSFHSTNARDYVYNYYRNPDLLSTCFEWTANSFEEWTIPDPTFNGLFPAMTSEELKELILDDGSDWRKTSCDTTDFDF